MGFFWKTRSDEIIEDIQKLTEYDFNVRENLFKIKNIVEQFFAEN